jgi:trigger factor
MIQKEIKKLPGSLVEINVTVPWEEWKKYIEPAAEELSRDLKIAGFRPGKAPMAMIEKQVGKERILETAGEKSIQKTYAQIIEEEKLDVIGAPKAEILKAEEGQSLEYKIGSALMPKVALSEWKDKIKKVNAEYKDKKVEVKEEEIDAELKKLAATRAKLITVNREAKDGDAVVIDFEVKRSGVPIENGTSRNHTLILGKGAFIPGFEEQLLGMKEGEEKEFELSFPQSYHEKSLAGTPSQFKVKMNLVQDRQIPEVDDAFAKSLGKFESLEEIKTNMRASLTEEKTVKQKEERRAKFVEALVESTEIDLPHVLVHQELHKMLDEFGMEIQSMGLTMDVYFEKMGKTKAEVEKEWEPQAKNRVKAALILEELAAEKEIVIPAEKIEEEMNKTLQFYKNVKNVEKDIDMERLYNYTKGILVNEEVFLMLEKM